MLLNGCCHCQAVGFSVESHEPVPFMRCCCSICRKTAGTGGFAVNLGADHATLTIEGMDQVSVYRAPMDGGHPSSGHRHFCKQCGTALWLWPWPWLWDPSWPALVHPHAGAIDTPLPSLPSVTHMMLGSKSDWVEAQVKGGDACFDAYPQESLADWHRRNGVNSWRPQDARLRRFTLASLSSSAAAGHATDAFKACLRRAGRQLRTKKKDLAPKLPSP